MARLSAMTSFSYQLKLALLLAEEREESFLLLPLHRAARAGAVRRAARVQVTRRQRPL